MGRVVLFAQVKDPAEWERKFKTHGALFREMTQTVTDYTIEGNEIAIYEDVDDLETYFEDQRAG